MKCDYCGEEAGHLLRDVQDHLMCCKGIKMDKETKDDFLDSMGVNEGKQTLIDCDLKESKGKRVVKSLGRLPSPKGPHYGAH